MSGSHLAIEDTPRAPVWGADDATLERWPSLTPGTEITIVKWSSKDGREHARYPGTVVASDLPSPWVVFETHWTYGAVRQAGLTFETGDVLHEIFSPIHPYDAFAVYRPTGELKGWYGNVTHPASFTDDEQEGEVLVWHDLYLDLVGLPSGEVAILDEDELAESGMRASDPDLHARVLAARDELIERFKTRQAPFSGPHHIGKSATP